MALHEIWEYDDEKHIQKLVGFHLLCEKCHWIKHLGLAGLKLKEEELKKLIQHFCKVNGCSKQDFEQHKYEAFEVYDKRCKYRWTQDFGEYEKYIDWEKMRTVVRDLNKKYFGINIQEEIKDWKELSEKYGKPPPLSHVIGLYKQILNFGTREELEEWKEFAKKYGISLDFVE